MRNILRTLRRTYPEENIPSPARTRAIFIGSSCDRLADFVSSVFVLLIWPRDLLDQVSTPVYLRMAGLAVK